VADSPGESDRPRFAIFRAKDALGAAEMTCMTYEAVTPLVADAAQRAQAAGADAGNELKLLFAIPGFSLTYVWFKSGFPLPRHSHNVDCLYYILGGSLMFGQEELGAGDGFFVGQDVPYTYQAGSAGVEVLEFRAANLFNIKILANNPAFWDMAIDTMRSRQGQWAQEPRPTKDVP
jgi:hypothetical protein